MNFFKIAEGMLKHSLKNKRRITMSLIVSFLITGEMGFISEEVLARDLRSRAKTQNEIKVDPNGGPGMNKSANGTDVVQINEANKGGISHNKFIDFSVGDENGVIFNNNATKEPINTNIGGNVTHNPNLSKSATAILSEVTGNRASNINGVVEIAGQRADFILANENGIAVNGGSFLNTTGVTLSTGSPTVSGSDINLNVRKGKVLIDEYGVATRGSYFNIIANTIELKGRIAPLDQQNSIDSNQDPIMDANLTLLAGQNDAILKNNAGNRTLEYKVAGQEKNGEKYGIYADNLGSMYGKNIRLISTTEGLGVRHEGLIKGMQDITILSSGDVVVTGIMASRNIELEGKGDLHTLSRSYKDANNVEINYYIKAGSQEGDISLKFVDGDITLENSLDANGNDDGSIKIVAKNLVLKAESTAEIIAKKSIDIKLSGAMNLEARVYPVDKTRGTAKPPLVITKDSNNNVVIKDPETGRIYNSTEVDWESSKVFANVINIEADDLTNEGVIYAKSNSIAEKSLNLNIANTLINKKLIASGGVVDIKAKELLNEKDSLIRGSSLIISANDINNKGELRQNNNTGNEASSRAGKVSINFKEGSFVNSGIVAGYSVDIVGKGFLLNEKDGRIETSTEYFPRGLGDITIDVKRLDNQGGILASSIGKGRDCNIIIKTEIFSNLSGGKVYAEAGGIYINSTVSDISNAGEIIAKKDLKLTSENNVINSGILGGENITVIAEKGNFENYGKVAAVEKLMIHVNNLINAGSPEEITKYLEAFNSYVKENLKEVETIKSDLKEKIKKDPKNEGLKETLKYYEEVELELVQLRNELDRLGALGILSGNDIEIKTKENTINKGIVKANLDISMEAGKDVVNSGIIEGNNDVTLKAIGDVKNSQKIYAGNDLKVSAKNFSSSWKAEDSDKYANLIKEYNADELEKAENKIVELEKKLISSNDKDEIEKIKTELEGYRAIKSKQAKLKAEISGMAGLGVVESKNVKIETIDNIENDGIIISNKNLEMKSGKDINNRGSISVGEDAEIIGQNFTNSNMSVGKDLSIKVEKDFKSKSLKVAKDLSIEAEKVKIEKDLYTGNDAKIKLSGIDSKTEFSENSEVNIKGNLEVKGGDFSNKGKLVVGNKLAVDTLADPKNKGNKSFENTGSIDVDSDINIKSEGFDSKGNILSGGKLNVDAGRGLFNTEKKLQAKGGADIKSEGFVNKGEAIFGGDTNIEAGNGAVENKSLEVTGNTSITTTSDFKNLEKLQNTEKLKINAKNFENVGDILNKGLDATISEKSENTGKIDVSGDLTLKGIEANSSFTNTGEVLVKNKGNIDVKGSVKNSGKLATGDEFKINASGLINKSGGIIQSGKELDIKVKETLINEETGKINGGKINIDGTNQGFKEFTNKGEIISNGALTVDLDKNNIDINLNNTSKMSSQELMTLKTGGNINNEGKFQNLGGLNFSASKDIVNKGMIVTNNNIDFKANNVINESGKTIWAAKNVVIDADDTIYNKRGARIESKGNMDLTSDSLINSAGLISSGKDMNIRTNKLKNESYISGSNDLIIVGYDIPEGTNSGGSVIYQTVGVCKYRQVEVSSMPIYGSDQHILSGDRATIQSGGNLSIKGKDANTSSDIENISGTVSAKNDITIVGSVKNITVTPKEMSIKEYLDKIPMKKGVYVTTTLGLPLPKQSYIDGTGSINDLLPEIMENAHSLTALKQACNGRPELKMLLNQALGNDWMAHDTIPRSVYEANKSKPITFTPKASVQAKIIAGGTITQTGGVVENRGSSEYKEKTNVQEVTIGEHKVDGTSSNLVIKPKDPNSITELDKIKIIHKEEIQTGKVTLNGIEINAASGETVKAIAVAGTINPILYIEIPIGTDGMFKPGVPKEDGKISFKYETNIDFINVNDYYGSDYFFKQIGYNPNKTSTVIGDAYYESELINRTAKEGLGYSGEIGTDQIKKMLDNSVAVKDELGLTVGSPLTADQINQLEEDIIWYVEMEVDNTIVLVPQVYFGKNTRIEMAQNDQGTGTGSVIKGNNIDINATNVVNMNGTIAAKENIDIKSENKIINNVEDGGPGGIFAGKDITLDAEKDIEMIGGIVVSNEGGVDVNAKGDIKIETSLGYDEDGNQAIANAAGIIAKEDISTTSGGKTTIKGGVISSSDGSVDITGNNVEILDQNIVKSDYSNSYDGVTATGTSAATSTSSGSIIVAGKGLKINSETDVKIVGSGVAAKEKVVINAKENVNILDGQEYAYQKVEESHSGMKDGMISIGSSSSERSESTSKGSTVGGSGGLDINSGKNTTIKGSKLQAGGDGINIVAGENVEILDGKDTMTSKSDSKSFSFVGYSESSENEKSSTSKGSELDSGSTINIKSGKDVKVVGAKVSAKGDIDIVAKENATFESGKNEYEHNKKAFSVGVTSASAKAGVAGASATAGWDPFAGGNSQASTGHIKEVSVASQNKSSAGQSGKNYMDSIASTQVTIGYANTSSSEKDTTWTASDVKTTGSFKVKAGETADIGGVNVDVEKDYKVVAGNIETTKYVDVSEKESSGISVGVKLENKVTSSITDAANKGAQIYDAASTGKVNEALVTAQVAGTVSNVIFGDLAANTTSATAEFQKNDSYSKSEKENITKIKAGENVIFETTKGDINLKGVKIDAGDASIVSAGSINITDAKEKYQETSSGISASVGVTSTSGVSVLSGASTSVGVAVQGSYNNSKIDNEKSNASSINVKNKITLKSEKDTNLVGATIDANDVNLDIKGNLKVETVADKINESRVEGYGGFDVSAGVATNTILTASGGISAGGGKIYKEGTEIREVSGITAKNSINGKVGGDTNLDGGTLGSETGKGNLDIGGKLVITDKKSDLKGGGAIVGISGGTKGGGIQGEVGDVIDKKITAKGTLGLDTNNLTVKETITTNGQVVTKEEVNKDIKNALVIDKDVKKTGGTFSGSASALPGKDKKTNAAPDGSTPRPTPTPDGSPTPQRAAQTDGSPTTPRTTQTDAPPKPPRAPQTDVVVQKKQTAAPKDTTTNVPPVKPKVEVPVLNKDTDTPNKVVVKKDTTDGGYKKNTETGKWSNSNPTDPGAILTGGGITNKNALDGFRKGANSLNVPKPKVETPKVAPKVTKPVADTTTKPDAPKKDVPDGKYVKNTETGKWSNSNPTDPGAILTGGGITNKNALDGFRKGANSLNVPKPKVETPKVTPKVTKPVVDSSIKTELPKKIITKQETATMESPKVIQNGKTVTPVPDTTVKADTPNKVVTKTDVVDGKYVKDTQTGKWSNSNPTDPGAILTGGGINNNQALDGFRKGANSLNVPKPKVETPKVTKPVVDSSIKTELPKKIITKQETATMESPKVVQNGKTVTPVPDTTVKADTPNKVVTKTDVVDGKYVKDTQTGKWSNSNPTDPGVILTGGGINNNQALDGFRKGANSLNVPKPKVETPKVTKPVSDTTIKPDISNKVTIKTDTVDGGNAKKSQKENGEMQKSDLPKVMKPVVDTTIKIDTPSKVNVKSDSVDGGTVKNKTVKPDVDGAVPDFTIVKKQKQEYTQDDARAHEKGKVVLPKTDGTEPDFSITRKGKGDYTQDDARAHEKANTVPDFTIVKKQKQEYTQQDAREQGMRKEVNVDTLVNKIPKPDISDTTIYRTEKNKTERSEEVILKPEIYKKQKVDVITPEVPAKQGTSKTLVHVEPEIAKIVPEKVDIYKGLPPKKKESTSSEGVYENAGTLTPLEKMTTKEFNEYVKKAQKEQIKQDKLDKKNAEKEEKLNKKLDKQSAKEKESGTTAKESKEKVEEKEMTYLDLDLKPGRPEKGSQKEGTSSSDGIYENKPTEDVYSTVISKKSREETANLKPKIPAKPEASKTLVHVEPEIAKIVSEKVDIYKGLPPKKQESTSSDVMNGNAEKRSVPIEKRVTPEERAEKGKAIYNTDSTVGPPKPPRTLETKVVEKRVTPEERAEKGKAIYNTDSTVGPPKPPRTLETKVVSEITEAPSKQVQKGPFKFQKSVTSELETLKVNSSNIKSNIQQINVVNEQKRKQIEVEKKQNKQKIKDQQELSKQIAKSAEAGESVFYTSQERGNESENLIKNKKEFKEYINKINESEKKQNKLDKKNDENNIKLNKQKAKSQEELSNKKLVEPSEIASKGDSSFFEESKEFKNGKEFKEHIDKINKEPKQNKQKVKDQQDLVHVEPEIAPIVPEKVDTYKALPIKKKEVMESQQASTSKNNASEDRIQDILAKNISDGKSRTDKEKIELTKKAITQEAKERSDKQKADSKKAAALLNKEKPKHNVIEDNPAEMQAAKKEFLELRTKESSDRRIEEILVKKLSDGKNLTTEGKKELIREAIDQETKERFAKKNKSKEDEIALKSEKPKLEKKIPTSEVIDTENLLKNLRETENVTPKLKTKEVAAVDTKEKTLKEQTKQIEKDKKNRALLEKVKASEEKKRIAKEEKTIKEKEKLEKKALVKVEKERKAEEAKYAKQKKEQETAEKKILAKESKKNSK